MKLVNTQLVRYAALVLSKHTATLPNPTRNLAGAKLNRISEKWPDSRFAGARAEIQHNPT